MPLPFTVVVDGGVGAVGRGHELVARVVPADHALEGRSRGRGGRRGRSRCRRRSGGVGADAACAGHSLGLQDGAVVGVGRERSQRAEGLVAAVLVMMPEET